MPDVRRLLEEAAAVEEHAESIRRLHRRRFLPERRTEIATAIRKVNNVQSKLRSVIHASLYRHVSEEAEVREASRRLQRQRKKLRKMQAIKRPR